MSAAPQPGDRVLSSLLQPLAPGEAFRHWPLHVTVFPWFRTDLTTHDLQQLLADTLQGIEPFTATMGETAHFGYQSEVPVRVVLAPNQFEEIHQRVLRAFDAHPDIKIIAPEHIGPNFRAHVTLHGYEPLREGDIVACNDLQIVHLGAIHPGGSTKEVEGEIDLGKPHA
ncbi:MAG TPA: 2'-5' RNA ligase family protein [Candidatus Saccharimonadales bacterium]|nr:2'-5' RNA ligase family protein [Candidatus Saccharimonadales bacterium]